jgi:ATP-dependent RNA helicase RhlE
MRKKSFFNGAPSTRGNSTFRGGRPQRFNRKPASRGAYIHPDKFINAAVAQIEQAPFVPQHKFTDFALPEKLKQNIIDKGYVNPTPIQDGAIKPILEGRDVLGLAATGTGKTAAFTIPLIVHSLRNRETGTALIMAPTRELAQQINQEFIGFAKGIKLFSALCVGGVPLHRQKVALQRRPHVVIGTPGRLKDLVQQGALRLDKVHTLVLDEADRMLDMGFIADIRMIVGQMPTERQTLFFSATITPDIQNLINQFLREPVTINVRTTDTSQNVEQNVIKAGSKDEKLQILADLLKKPDFDKVLVFGATKYGVQRLSDALDKQGFKSQAIHGNKSQSQRQRALDAFKSNQVQVLVATDVAARGLDIPRVSHVINFDQPNTYEDYIHRIGRTGRAGQSGNALTFVPHGA